MSKLKEPYNLSPRVKWLRDYYFKGVERKWNNEALAFTTGTEYDDIYDELTFYIVPEVHNFFNPFVKGILVSATRIDMPENFFKKSIPERKQYFNQKAIVDYVPQEILPGDLIAGGHFNIFTSRCLTAKEAKEYKKALRGKGGFRERLFEIKDRGIGNCGPTSGHLIPDYATVIREGFKAKQEYFQALYEKLTEEEKAGKKGGNLRAMIGSCSTPKLLADKYSAECARLAALEKDAKRKKELQKMSEINKKVPWLPAEDFYEAVQSLWMTHMLVMSDENYPGPGVSFGRLDQYLYPYYMASIAKGEDKEFLKDIIKC
ncbi:MAG: hypothetical protein EOM87_03845, partial [Clostridia bacterium]|nr:hypothetical protein [Clostridia bacterium]